MTLPTSGNPIKFSEIESEFGGAPSNNLGAYRISAESYGGKSFSTLDTGIPSSGTIKFGDFHGKKLNVVVDCHTDCAGTRVNAKTEYDNNNVNCVGSGTLTSPAASRNASDSSGHKVFIRVNKTIGSASGSVNNCALRTGSFESGTSVSLDVGGSGKIVGAGGDGGNGRGAVSDEAGESGEDGTSALGIEHNGTAVTIEGGGLIVCGFGGGGGGGSGRDEDIGSDRSAGGGGGGGGAGLPAGEGGSGGGGESGGSAGGDGSIPAGGEQSGGAGGGGESGEADGGEGGRGGDQENGAASGGAGGGDEETGPGGSAGGNGSAIRKSADEIGYTLSGSTGGGSSANTGAESGGGNIGVS